MCLLNGNSFPGFQAEVTPQRWLRQKPGHFALSLTCGKKPGLALLAVSAMNIQIL